MTKKIITILLFAAIILSPNLLFAEDLSSLSSLKEYYANQAKKAKTQAAQKQQEAAAIQTQIRAVESQITDANQSLEATSGQIDSTQDQIVELEKGIKDQNFKLGEEKDKLGGIISSWYMEGEDTLLEAVLSSSSVSDLVSKHSYYDSIKQQMEGQIERIETIKSKLEGDKAEQDGKLQSLSSLKKSQEDQKNYLQTRKNLKSALLNNTAKAIDDLIDEQKANESKVAELQGKIDRIRASSIGAGGDVVSATEPSWYYRQNDDRWSSYKIGSYSTIGLYGCLLTSLTMVADYYGSSYTPITAAQNSRFVRGGRYDGALLSTSIVNDGGSQSINWNTIDSELAAGHPVIVGVSLGVDMGNSYGVSHFVVIKSKIGPGKYAMHDPLGENRGYRKDQIKAMRIIRP